jgi:hypothetical protein
MLTVGHSLQATSSLPSRAARLAAQRLRNGQDLEGVLKVCVCPGDGTGGRGVSWSH